MKNIMSKTSSDFKLVEQLCFRLLPVQILFAIVDVANGIFSSLFASNYIGTQALSAVGLYNPIRLFISAIGIILFVGSQILVGRYIGKNQMSKARNIFSLNVLISVLFIIIVTLFLVIAATFDLTVIFTHDEQIRAHFNQYLLGSAVGILPQLLGQQFSGFLSLENQNNRNIVASVSCIISTVALNYLFIVVLKLEAFGLALASSIGLWVFFLVQAQYYLGRRSEFSFSFKNLDWKDSKQLFKIGLTSALSRVYRGISSIIVNALLLHYAGSIGLSAFVACNTFMDLFWSVPVGMYTVSRMLISVSIGEEDRTTLNEIMRVAFFRFIPILTVIAMLVFFSSDLLTQLYCQDTSSDMFNMTALGFKILPMCMPLNIVYLHFAVYAQASSKYIFANILSLFNGVISLSLFSFILLPFWGINGVYTADVIKCIISIIIVVVYARVKIGRFPRTIDDLMTFPKNFGVPKDSRIDIALQSMDDAVGISRKIHRFCIDKGIDKRRSYFSSIALEEIATIIIDYGFNKPKHAISLRVTCKDDTVILRLKDNCKPFDYTKIRDLMNPQDPAAHIGIRVLRHIVQEANYQKILGMNTLTLKI
ncbi:MAG: MATE family efflux transporter [Clostridia bacterium]|nr:MATE family efflux transporter [Clostridia bacterium]